MDGMGMYINTACVFILSSLELAAKVLKIGQIPQKESIVSQPSFFGGSWF